MDRPTKKNKMRECPNIDERYSSIMNSLPQFLAFASTARHGNFARAARDLGLTPSTVAKSVARLEERLGVKLFHRTTRQVSLTADGEQLFVRCQRVLSEVDELEAMAAGARNAPSGTLRIDMPITYGKRVVLPTLAKLMERFPQLHIDARLSDQYCDPVRDGLDAVVRVGGLADSRLVAKRISQQSLVVCASPDYLSRAGSPQTPPAIEHHACILFRTPTSGRERPWQFRKGKKEIDIQPPSRMALNDGEAMVAAACAGVGLTQVPDYMVKDAIAAGKLIAVLQNFQASPMPISLVYPSNRMVTPRLRALMDALVAGIESSQSPRSG